MKIAVVFFVFVFASCARIPYQAVALMDSIEKEGHRMHDNNVALVNAWFAEKRVAVDQFMNEVYLPEYSAEMKKVVPDNEPWTNVITAMIPVINSRRDSLQQTLTSAQGRVVGQLNSDFQLYSQACAAQKDLLTSAVKVTSNRTAVFDQLKQDTKNKIDLNSLEPMIANLLQKGGTVADHIEKFNTEIEYFINRQK